MSAVPEAAGAVTVVLRREERQRGRWHFPHWTLAGLLPGEHGTRHGTAVHAGEGATEYVWPGLAVRLLASQAETYWFNLTSAAPSIFVVCREDSVWGLMPVSVTLDHDEASRQTEGDGEVFAATIPEVLIERLERFVMSHYQPGERRRRRGEDDAQ